MSYHLDDTIAAVASATGGAGRGIVRISGPRTLECLAACFLPREASRPLSAAQAPTCVVGSVRIDGDDQPPLFAPGTLFLWPGERSYTRQPAAEFHTLGSPPLVSAVLGQVCRGGARPARPGEFTLRAFLAGRIDLMQAEAVLGVVDARSADDLAGALDQLAGGLSRPIDHLREQLLALLAELEAGLDFADEDIVFIPREDVRRRLSEGQRIVATALAQISGRDRRSELPRVMLTGPTNVGKSRLFNALVERYGAGAADAIVSATPGSTRDYLSAPLRLSGLTCELVDAAGEVSAPTGGIDLMTQEAAAVQRARADVELRCLEAAHASAEAVEAVRRTLRDGDLVVLTKTDLGEPTTAERVNGLDLQNGVVRCSSATGCGVEQVASLLRHQIEQVGPERAGGGYAAATAARCTGSLAEADRAMRSACDLPATAGDELVAAEVRAALAALGEVVGQVGADDVLDRIFSQFCIGK